MDTLHSEMQKNVETDSVKQKCAPEGGAPRPYRMGRRQIAADQNRARIIAAARDLIVGEDALKAFTIDAVAQRAGVARMTVYHQFKSKLGLLEALLDDLALRSGMDRLALAFSEPDPLEAMKIYIATFCDLWAADPLVMTRLRALNTLDPDFGQTIRERSGWRRTSSRRITAQLSEKYPLPSVLTADQGADILFALTSFNTFEALAGENRSAAEVTLLLQHLAQSALGLGKSPPLPS